MMRHFVDGSSVKTIDIFLKKVFKLIQKMASLQYSIKIVFFSAFRFYFFTIGMNLLDIILLIAFYTALQLSLDNSIVFLLGK